jgi:hypothetical protein
MRVLILSFLMINLAFATGESEKKSLVDNILTKMNINLSGSFAGYDGEKISKQVKTDLRTKLNSTSYQVSDLKQILGTLNDETFARVNKTLSADKINFKDILVKNPTEEFAKLDKEKQKTATQIEKKLDFKKYSKLVVSMMGEEYLGKIPAGLPESMVSSMKSEMVNQSEKGLLANFYERVGTVGIKDLQSYQGLLEKAPFQKYYKDLMDIGVKHLKKK